MKDLLTWICVTLPTRLRNAWYRWTSQFVSEDWRRVKRRRE